MKPSLQRLFFFSLALAIIALGWTTWGVLKLEKEEQASSLKITQGKQIQLALERINSYVEQFIHRESTRPIFSTFSSSSSTSTPPPPPPFVRSYFLLNPNGKLQILKPLSTTGILDSATTSSSAPNSHLGKLSHPVIHETPFLSHWQGGDLIFLKQVPTQQGIYTLSLWVDWHHLQAVLLREVHDLLPHASLLPSSPTRRRPLSDDSSGAESYTLTSLPASLHPGSIPTPPVTGLSSLRVALLIVWALFILGIGGLIALLIGTSRLSNRRASFVSAVTHELRTPLTNFSLYTEMLEEDLLPEDKKTTYLRLLRGESKRLIHLVENILAYSRIENNKADTPLNKYPVRALFDEIVPRLKEHLSSRGVDYQYSISPSATTSSVLTNQTSLEQILDNLADNAIKYATASHPRVSMELDIRHSFLHIYFRDNGPGIDDETRNKLFSPFFRSAEVAAGRQPGVGLGLALSRDTARLLGGDLRLDSTSTSGSVFLLTIPLT